MKQRPGRLAFELVGIDSVCRRGTPGVCRRRRRNSAYVAGDVTKHGATGVGAPAQVRELGHCRGDNIDMSYSGDDVAVALGGVGISHGVWCGRTRRTRQVRAGRVGRSTAPSVRV